MMAILAQIPETPEGDTTDMQMTHPYPRGLVLVWWHMHLFPSAYPPFHWSAIYPVEATILPFIQSTQEPASFPPLDIPHPLPSVHYVHMTLTTPHEDL